jgi:hypothetical protein
LPESADHAEGILNAVVPFSVAYEEFTLRGDANHGTAGSALLLHGAGASARHKFSILRNALAVRGVGMTCFDCIGHGETGGDMAASSLASRTRQAQAVIAAHNVNEPLALFGFSMGAYNAIKLTQSHKVASLVLIVPGVFTPQAYEVPFGPQFSNIIRRERSWSDTDAWDIVGNFSGRLLVIAAGNDAVIPREIPERLVQSAHCATWKQLLVVPEAEHRHLFSLLLEQPNEFDATLDLISQCLGVSRKPG